MVRFGRMKIFGTLLKQLRSYPKAFYFLLLGAFLNRFGMFVMPFLTIFMTRSGFEVESAGLVVGMYGFGYLCASVAGGILADRIGQRRTIIFSMISSAGAMLLLSQADSLPELLLLCFLAGFFSELFQPAAQAMVVELCESEDYVVAISLYRLMVNLAFGLSPIVAGFFAEREFFILFLGDAVSSVVFAAIAYAVLPVSTAVKREKPSERVSWVATMVRDARFMRFLLASTLAAIVLLQMDTTLALHVIDSGHSSLTFGLLLSLNGLLIVSFEVLLTVVIRDRSPSLMIAIGFALIGLGFLLTGFVTRPSLLAVTVLIWTVGEMICSPLQYVYVARIAPKALVGRYMGMLMATWSIAMIVGPVLGTQIYSRDPLLHWLSCGFLGVCAAALMLWGNVRRPLSA